MKPLKIVALINLVALLAYSILIRVFYKGSGSEAGLSILIMSAFAVGIHVIICFGIALAAYVSKSKERGRAWLLSAGIVLLIGFSVCLGNASF